MWDLRECNSDIGIVTEVRSERSFVALRMGVTQPNYVKGVASGESPVAALRSGG